MIKIKRIKKEGIYQGTTNDFNVIIERDNSTGRTDSYMFPLEIVEAIELRNKLIEELKDLEVKNE